MDSINYGLRKWVLTESIFGLISARRNGKGGAGGGGSKSIALNFVHEFVAQIYLF